ncbi:hypothetical protein L1987_20811 [Smallanthus sonchifolius]|uniref:Uncharacterized protein n=1 Tax=Smallanthus sonchifolius TaxID=185202 RepID=A0ACB9ISW2_9ASTR|nr:hypothetical protein L1987_20811 [Smallanthus sonchifolius]
MKPSPDYTVLVAQSPWQPPFPSVIDSISTTSLLSGLVGVVDTPAAATKMPPCALVAVSMATTLNHNPGRKPCTSSPPASSSPLVTVEHHYRSGNAVEHHLHSQILSSPPDHHLRFQQKDFHSHGQKP